MHDISLPNDQRYQLDPITSRIRFELFQTSYIKYTDDGEIYIDIDRLRMLISEYSKLVVCLN